MSKENEEKSKEEIVEEVKEKSTKEMSIVTDKVLKKKFMGGKKKRARIGTAFVYEYVGDQEVFDGAYPLLKGGVKDIAGDYTVIDYNGKMKFLSTPNPEDFTPTYNKIKKILHVVKMAEDDFRVKKRLTDDYYKEEIVYLEKEEEVINPETKEVLGSRLVPDLDKNGEQKYEVNRIHYKRPSAIVQEGREAIKEGNEYEKKMSEWKKKDENWFKKNAFAIMSYGVLMLMVISFLFLGGKIVDEFSEIRNQIYEDNEKTKNYISNGLINSLADKVAQKTVEGNNPPE